MKLFEAVGSVLGSVVTSVETASRTVNKTLETFEHIVEVADKSVTIPDVALDTLIAEQQLSADEARFNLESKRAEFDAMMKAKRASLAMKSGVQ